MAISKLSSKPLTFEGTPTLYIISIVPPDKPVVIPFNNKVQRDDVPPAILANFRKTPIFVLEFKTEFSFLPRERSGNVLKLI